MGIFEEVKTPAVKVCEDLRAPPPQGHPHCVALPGTKKEGRSEVYRNWRFQDGLIETLTEVSVATDFCSFLSRSHPCRY